ncbi:mucin-16-like isoform X2 [Oncorhynchus clarkii lewisi]|uniref:mucin-16-like isoform X2 n=1 Tax=Oncorhynchus clarkii lewisi TaxID=490388 RepID=UPI0039B9A25C
MSVYLYVVIPLFVSLFPYPFVDLLVSVLAHRLFDTVLILDVFSLLCCERGCADYVYKQVISCSFPSHLYDLVGILLCCSICLQRNPVGPNPLSLTPSVVAAVAPLYPLNPDSLYCSCSCPDHILQCLSPFHFNLLLFLLLNCPFAKMEDDEDTTSTETTVRKGVLIRDSTALASPDLLSDVSEMKQDLIKMTAILTTDSTDKSRSMEGSGLEKGAEEVQGEPFEIMEKVKEDLEKVGKILRSGTYEGEVAKEAASAARMKEEWVLLSDCEIEEAKHMAALEPQEPVLREVRVNRGIPRPKAIKDVSGMVKHLSGELKEYLLDVPEGTSTTAQEKEVQDKFTEVVLRKGAKRTMTTTKTTTTTTTTKKDIKIPAFDLQKPVRRKGKDQEQVEKSTDGDVLLSVPKDPKPVSPVSPVVEETPIGSIKDKVKALQQKVEAERKGQKATSTKPSNVAVESKIPQKAKESIPKQSPAKQCTAKQGPLKSPKTESEKLEETMSVRELMRSFQKGQDPSKRKSGLFELKTVSSEHETTESELQPTQSKSTINATSTCYEREVSLDAIPGKHHTERDKQINPPRKHSKDFGVEIKAELEDNPEYQQFRPISVDGSPAAQSYLTETIEFPISALDDSSDSLKHEGVADSPSASLGDFSPPHLSSEDSLKHQGLATPGTSPDSLSLSPKNADQSTKNSTAVTIAVEDDKKSKDKSGDSGVGTIDDQPSNEITLPVSSSKAADDHTTSESITFQTVESKSSKPRKLTKRVSETLESFLSDEESLDDKLVSALAATIASSASTENQGSLELPLRQQDSDALSPFADDDSLTISHRDSLDEGSPLMEDNSSHRTPDSIEPSPTKESPCRDSLESSPVEQKNFPPAQASDSASHPEPSKATDYPPDVLRSRLLRDQEASANDDDSIEQTLSQMESSGKSPLSPDTPSSEEVSYEVNPKTPDNMFLSVVSTPAVINEDSGEDDDESEAQRKFTPEEEMFKMAAKIKTFEEMDQDARTKENSRKYISASADDEAGDDSFKTVELESANETELTGAKETSELALSAESLIKVQPPSPFSAGVHEGVHHTEAKSVATTAAVEGTQCVSEQHVSQSVPSHKDTDDKDSLAQMATMSSSSEGAANITDEQKEESLRNSRGSKEDDGGEKEADTGSLQTSAVKAPCQVESNITDEVKGDYRGHSGAPEAETSSTIIIRQAREMFKPEICIYDDTEEDDEEEEPPRTKSKGVTASAEADPWSAMREDDDAFAARVKEEEQKILGLMVDRHSQGETPDTTPGRSPTEESTPTSEPNPFLFQEGKLFEMTRSGAIDMTKRTYEDEGFAFFQIGEQPLEEALSEQVREEPGDRGAPLESEVGLNLTLEIKVEEDEKQAKDAPEDDQTVSGAVAASPSKSDASKSRIPRMGLSASAKTTKKDKDSVSPEALEVKPDTIVEETTLEVENSYLDPMIANVETAVTTVTRSVYPEQDQESSDSSPEEQHSVIELPKTMEKITTPTSSEKVKKIPTKTQAMAPAKAGPQSRAKTSSSSTSPYSATPKKETPSTESKSRIPVKGKANPVKPEPSVKHTESSQDTKLKFPVKKDLRRKSETDAGLSAVTKTKTSSSKAKSFCEGDETSAEKSQVRPMSADYSTKPKSCFGFQSRLPVRGKLGQPSHTSTPAKKKSEPRKKSIEFVNEISDEAAKLVERLAQAEKDKEREAATAAISDDESSGIDPSAIERESFPEMHFPTSGDVYPIRPLWDDPVDTQMQRIPNDTIRRQDPQDEAERKEERLEIIADHLGFSWTELARELEFSEERINLIRLENPNSLQDQSHALLKLWTDRDGKHATETTLIKRLTKINRMDIVHLIETKIIKSTQQDTSSHTYAEIERTIALDHSEAFSALHEDIDSPRPCRRTGGTPSGPGSRQGPFMVSEEDLSSSMSSLHETSGRVETDTSVTGLLRHAQKEKLQKEGETTHSVGGTSQSGSDKAESLHMGTFKQVSPFFTLYRTSPYQLTSHVLDPAYNGPTPPSSSSLSVKHKEKGAQRGAECGEGSLQPPQAESDNKWLLSPTSHQESPTKSSKRVCESRPLSMTDFGDSLTECDQAEPDFSELSVELQQTSEYYTYLSTSSVTRTSQTTELVSEKISITAEAMNLPLPQSTQLPQASEVVRPKETSEIFSEDHIDEVSHRLYEVLFGYVEKSTSEESKKTPMELDEVPRIYRASRVYEADSPTSMPLIDVNQATLDQEAISTELYLRPVDFSPVTPESITFGVSKESQTIAQTSSDVSRTTLIPESVTVESIVSTAFIQISHDSTAETRAEVSALPVSELDMSLSPESLRSETKKRSLSPDSASKYATKIVVSMHDQSSSPELVTSEDRSGSKSPDSHIPEYRPSTPDSSILLTESRASSPESLSSDTELSLLLPDSPIPQFRPLSPLPPPEVEWETAEIPSYALGQMFLSAPGAASSLLAPGLAEAEDRPLTPMVPNRGEFSRAISPGSEYLERRALSPDSPQSIVSDTEERPLSAESLSDYRPMSATSLMLLNDIKASSPVSTGSVDEHRSLSPDSPITQFWQSEPIALVKFCRSSSPESIFSDIDYETTPLLSLLYKDRPSSPESIASIDEYRALSPDSPTPQFWHILPDSIVDYRSSSPESVSSETKCVPMSLESIGTEHRPDSPEALDFEKEITYSALTQSKSLCVSPITVTESGINVPESPPILTESATAPLFEFSQPEPQKGLSVPDVAQPSSVSPRTVSASGIHFPPSAILEPEYRLVYDAELWKLISQINDQQYAGKTYCSKTGVFEYAGQRKEETSEPEKTPLSIDSPVEESDFKPESLSEYRSMSSSSLMLLKDIKTTSPESTGTMDEHRSLSPDFPVPKYSPLFREAVPFRHGSSSPESLPDDEVSEIFDSISVTIEDRPVSPESAGSVSERSSCSKDQDVVTESGVLESPPIIFNSTAQLFPELRKPETQKGLSVAGLAQTPKEPSVSPRMVSDEGIHDPPSVIRVPAYKLKYDAELWKLVSPIHDPQYVGETPKTGMFEYAEGIVEYVQTSERESPTSSTEVTEDRPLSSDSESEHKPLPPESVKIMAVLRSDKAESVKSLKVCKSLSPDSPIPQYSLFFLETAQSYHRSLSPESVSDAEVEVVDSKYSIVLGIDARTSSPESIGSVNEHRPLSPDSPIPEFRQELPESAFSSTRSRSSSPESVTSGNSEMEYILSEAFDFCQRPDSPESIVSDTEERPLSPESLSEYCPMSPESVMLLTNIRSSSVYGYRSSSPESVIPGTPEVDDITSEAFAFWQRPDSPESTASVDEYRCLSPDSPLPQYFDYFPEPTLFMSGYRSVSPESICSNMEYETELFLFASLLFEDRPSSPDSIPSIDEYRALSPDSPITEFRHAIPECVTSSVYGYRSSSPESVISGTSEVDDITSEAFAFWQRPDSPESTASVDEYRCLSPDSPLPQYFDYFPEPVLYMAGSRSSSPASVLSDDDCDLSDIFLTLFSERGRPSSPESVASVDEYMALSPDSPIPDFWPSLPESIPHFIGYRSTSPESDMECGTLPLMSLIYEDKPRSLTSVWSDNECELSDIFSTIFSDKDRPSSEAFAFWQRPDSPESIVSDTEERPLSPESLSEYCPMSPESVMLLTNVRSSSPESTASVDEYMCLSPDSPLPQYLQHYPEPTLFMARSRSSSPVSVLSDLEYETELFSFTSMLFEDRPDSVASVDDYRALSPDSPIPEFRQNLLEYFVECRSSSPESVTSDIEYANSPSESVMRVPIYKFVYDADRWKLISPIHDPQYVGETFASKTGMFEYCGSTIEYVQKSELLSQTLSNESGLRSDSPESVKSMDEHRSLSPDSPIPQYLQYFPEPVMFMTGSRPSSPDSVSSEEIGHMLSEAFSFWQRPGSPDSIASVDEYRALSPDSPIPEFRQDLPESVRYSIGYRSSSPDSVTSDIEYEPFISEVFFIESRPDSPESIVSDTEERPLSPESLSEYCPMSPESVMLLTNVRSSSPESTASVDEFRCLSPDSPLPQYLQYFPEPTIFMTGSRSSSPASVLSDEEFENEFFLYASMLFDDRPSSPDSIVSIDEYRTLSPDSPIPEFRHAIPECVTSSVYGYRSSSPESVISGTSEVDDITSEAFAFWQRPDSPESTASVDEYRCLSPDSPLPQYFDYFPEPVLFVAGSRSSSPASVLSDDDCDLSDIFLTLFSERGRPSSPESLASVDEYMALSPDSPIPDFWPSLPESIPHFIGYRSTSPESDMECGTLPLMSLIYEDKPRSLTSVWSDNECELSDIFSTIFSDKDRLSSEAFAFWQRPDSPESIVSDTEERPLSPESLSEYCPMSPESVMLLTNIRSSSPESTASVDEFRCLSPDSPLPQYLQHYPEPTLFMARSRSSSPVSVLSDLEYETELFLYASMLFDDRPSSPDSIVSIDEYRTLSPDSPIPEFRQALRESIVSMIGYRSSSPESLSGYETESETEFAPLISEIEERQDTPDSTTSVDEFRALSPDSPVPQYTQHETTTLVTGNRSASPESICSDMESETDLFLHTSMLFENRPSSPDSIASIDEYRALSPDSPIPEFRHAIPECVTSSVYGYRSSSPESVISGTSEVDDITSEAFAFRQRPDSPESTASVDEYRCLSPDSPLPQYFDYFPEPVLFMAGSRSSSPASVLSDDDCDLSDIFLTLFSERGRPSSPESVASVDEYMALSPDSPIPDFWPSLPESIPHFIGYRSTSPESDMECGTLPLMSLIYEDKPRLLTSVWSDIECELSDIFSTIFSDKDRLSSEAFAFWQRPDSPESIVSDTEERPLSPESLSEYCPMSPESVMLLTNIRSSSPESTASVDEFRCLSPDSPLPQYLQHYPEPTLFMARSRSSSPVSVLSDLEYETELFSFTSMLFEDRPDSVASVDDYRALSPDSPIPEFRQNLLEYFVECRSSSPESVTSDIEYANSPSESVMRVPIYKFVYDADRWKLISPIHDPQYVGETFASKTGMFEYCGSTIEYVQKSELLSQTLSNESGLRSDSPESVKSMDEHRSLSPDSPIPQYLQYFPEPVMFMTGSRPSSPDSVSSEEIGHMLSEAFSFWQRPGSPDSIASVDEYRALSPDSPIPEFRQDLPESVRYSIGYRSSSPDSVTSDIEYEPLISEVFFIESRPDSPESIVSDTEERPLSPESLSEYCPMSPESVMLLTNVRSSSPESTASVDEFRCLSPDSPLPQYLQYFPEPTIFMTGSRSSSPASVLSDEEFENEFFLYASMLFDDRPSSPDSIASIDEYRTLSPDSPIPEFRHAIPECVTSSVYGYRSSSPESGISGTSEVDDITSEAFAFWQRPDSPESTASVDEYRCLSPDSPLPQYLDYFPEPTLFMAGRRSSSPASVLSDDDCDLSDIFLTLFSERGRPSSPESVASVDEYMALSPDSPIPDFWPSLPESIPYFIGYRSTSPESLCSDMECGTLPLMSSFHEDRPRSLLSVWSDNECELSDIFSTIFSDKDRPSSEVFAFWQRPDSPESIVSDKEERPLSPESLSEYCPMSPESVMLLTNVRSSSPESTASVDEFRCLSPDSPLPQYLQYFPEPTIFMTGSRSSSPASVLSDEEFENELFLYASMLFDDRPSSPDSIVSIDEYRTLSPDSPIPEFRQVLRESMIGYRSSSPESVASDVEYAPLISESSSVELRPDSPESVASVNAFSTQSPIPLFTEIALGSTTVETGYRSSSPLSITSDMEFDLVFSNIEETVLPTKSLIPEHVSPSEILSIEATEQKPKAASSGSPVPGTAMMVEEYNRMYDTELCKLISQIHDTQYVGETFLSKTGFLEYTGSSEAHVETSPGEEDVAQGSTDVSPVPGPQVEPAATTETAQIDQDVALTESIECIQTSPEEREVARGSTEISTEALPDWQVEPSETTTETVKIDQDVAPTESVPSVSDIVLPESLAAEVVSECTFETGHRSASPHSKSDSGDEWVIVSVSETEDKPLSPESLPDCRPISPATLVLKADVRTSSPESVLFEKQVEKDRPLSTESVEYRTMSLESTMSMDKVRSSSPESMHEINDNRSLSPDSPIPQYTRSGVSGIDSCNMEYATIEHRSSSPESMTSGSEYELMVISSSALESRPSSPDSLESVGRNRRLSPDSPVPEFMRILSQYFMEPRALSDRTSSPESVSSDTVFVALPVDSWADVHRRQSSPESGASDEELSLVITGTETMTFKAGALSHVTSVLTSERLPMSPEENTVGVTLLSVPATKFEKEQGQMSRTDQGLPKVSGLVAEMVITSTEQARTKHGSEHAETIPTPQATMGLEDVKKVQKDVQVKQQPVKVKDRSEEEVEVLRLSADTIKTQDAPPRAPSQTPKEIQLKTSYGKMQSKLESTLVTESTLHEQKAVLDLSQETSISGLVSPKQTKTATGYKPLISTPLQISEQYPFTTHRAVTPKLKLLDSATQEFSDWSEFTQEEFEETHSGELFSPMSSQFLVPPDYEALFSGRHSLRVSECSQLSPTDMSPVSPVFSDPQSDKCQVTTTTLMGPEFASKSATPGSAEAFEFSPDFKRVIGEFEKTLSSFGPVVQSDPAQENSDLEFFDCKDDFSDFSEAEDLEPEEPEVLYHIEEPPSPTPFSSTLETGFLKGSPVCSAQFLRVDDQNRFSLGSESLRDYGIYDGPESESETVPTCEELPSRSQAGYDDDEYSLEREINEELGLLSSDSSEEEVLTTRVVRRRVIIQADDLPDIPPQTVTEEQYMDEHGNLVVKKITRKVIRKYFSPDGVEREEVTVEGSRQEMVSVEEGDGFSKVVKRTVVRSEGDQTELTFLEPLALGATTASDFESEQVQGRKVSKVVKTTVVRGERMEKQTGDSTLTADLPSAKEDFEKALSYAGGFGKIQLPHLVEKEVVKDDGSVVKRTQMRKSRTQKRTVVKDAQGKHVLLERLDDTPETLQPDALRQHLHLLLQRYCAKEEEEGEKEEEKRKKK